MSGDPQPAPAGRRASVRRRCAATVYESLLLGTLALVAGFALLAVVGPPAAPEPGQRLPLLATADRGVSFATLFALWGAYCTWLWSGRRRTLPMQTWQLRLRTADGGEVGPARAAGRYLAWWLGPALAVAAYLALRPYGLGRWALALLALNYAWALVDRDRQFLHDRLARTQLVRA